MAVALQMLSFLPLTHPFYRCLVVRLLHYLPFWNLQIVLHIHNQVPLPPPHFITATTKVATETKTAATKITSSAVIIPENIKSPLHHPLDNMKYVSTF